MVVHYDITRADFEGQGHRSKVKVMGSKTLFYGAFSTFQVRSNVMDGCQDRVIVNTRVDSEGQGHRSKVKVIRSKTLFYDACAKIK